MASLTACQQEMNQTLQTVTPEDGVVKVSVSVQFPEPILVGTKGKMGEGPLQAGFNLNFLIYGPGDGFVQNWIPAELSNPNVVNGYLTGGDYTVLLPLSDDKRIVHVIANPPQEIVPITNDYIYNIMEKLVTKKDSDDEASYWQEIVLEDGIKGVYEGGELVGPAPDLEAAFRSIDLVRNYAKVSVEGDSEEDFTVTRWALINVPDMAYVAPYDGTHDADFPKGYVNIASYTDPEDLLNQLTGTGEGQDNYPGYLPPEATIIQTFPGNPDEDGAANYTVGGGAQYMYERPLPNSSQIQTAVLVEVEFGADHALTEAYNKDHYDQSTDTYDEGFPVTSVKYWYKVELLDKNGDYCPFLRNIAYVLKISNLEEAGEMSAQAAYDGPYFGNISASLETASLKDLSNGKSSIHVDLMDYTFLSVPEDEDYVTLMNGSVPSRFWFTPDINYPDVVYTEDEADICDIEVELFPVTGYDASVSEFVDNGDGSIKVKLTETGSKVKKSIIRVSGSKIVDGEAERAIYREITVNLMEKQEFKHGTDLTELTIVPTVEGPNQEVQITLRLPEDLGASVFPIQVRIEAENNTLSATSSNLPVSTGKTVFGDGTRNTYFFIRTINYSEYCYLDPRTKKYVYNYNFPMSFFTSKAGDNSTDIDIRDMADDFIPKGLTLEPVNP